MLGLSLGWRRAPLLGNRKEKGKMGIGRQRFVPDGGILRTLVQAFVLPTELSEIIR